MFKKKKQEPKPDWYYWLRFAEEFTRDPLMELWASEYDDDRGGRNVDDARYNELVQAREVVREAILSLERVVYPSAGFIAANYSPQEFSTPDAGMVKALSQLRALSYDLGTRINDEERRRKAVAEKRASEGKVVNDFFSSKLAVASWLPSDAVVLSELRRIVRNNPKAFA